MVDDLPHTVRSVLVEVASRGDTITYGDLLAELRVTAPDLAERAQSELAAVLRAVSVAEDDAGRGLLTAVVIRADTGMPGAGFFGLAGERGRSVVDRRLAWVDELAAVHAAHSDPG